MLRIITKSALRVVKVSQPKAFAFRSFSQADDDKQKKFDDAKQKKIEDEKKRDEEDEYWGNKMPKNKDQAWGAEKYELDQAEIGIMRFEQKSIIPTFDQGTKENPILVPSCEQSRAVGYEDPNTHQLVWFNLAKGPLHFIAPIGLYFKLFNVKWMEE